MNTTRTPLREIVAYLGIAYSLALTVALALPDANINKLLSVMVPTVTVGILTFTLTPRGSRKKLWRGIGLGRAGLKAWPAAIVLPFVLCAGAYGTAVAIGVGELDIDIANATPSWAIDLVLAATDRHRLHPRGGDRVARIPAAADAAAHQQEAGGGRDRVRARLVPPAADPDRVDVQHRGFALDRCSGGRRRDHRGRGLLRLGLGQVQVGLAGGDRAQHREHRLRARLDRGRGHGRHDGGVRRRRDRVRDAGCLCDRRRGPAARRPRSGGGPKRRRTRSSGGSPCRPWLRSLQ